jgi:hypothetical protein
MVLKTIGKAFSIMFLISFLGSLSFMMAQRFFLTSIFITTMLFLIVEIPVTYFSFRKDRRKDEQ